LLSPAAPLVAFAIFAFAISSLSFDYFRLADSDTLLRQHVIFVAFHAFDYFTPLFSLPARRHFDSFDAFISAISIFRTLIFISLFLRQLPR
jgi:hypothetical protein